MESWIGPAIVAAFIAALVSVASWFVTAGQAIGAERRRRQEKVRDFQIALRAEIRSELASLNAYDLDENYVTVIERTEGDPDYVVLLPQIAPHFVFDAIVSDIHVLPEEVIDPIVLYMRQHTVLASLANDMRSGDFRKLAAHRKLATLSDFVHLRAHLRVLAEEAVAAIDASLRDPRDVQ